MTQPDPTPRPRTRLEYLDGLRGAALVFMVLNHTARWWMEGRMTWPRYHLIYVTLTWSAPVFLFLVGFCLPLSLRPSAGAPDSLITLGRRFVPRGVRVILAGLLLNVVVFRNEPVLSGGVLQMIGLSIIVMIPGLWALERFSRAPWVLLALAAGAYVAFALAFERLTRFVVEYPTTARILFYDFPPWPWLSLVLIGLVFGWAWLAARRESVTAERRYFARITAGSAIMLAAFSFLDAWLGTPVRFGLKRDFVLNNHWIPRGFALLWVLGTLLLMLAVAYWVMEVGRVRLPWLVLLGQTALFLYFVHQVIVLTIVNQTLGWRFNAWPQFGLANAVLFVLLLALGWIWREVRQLRKALPQFRSAPSG